MPNTKSAKRKVKKAAKQAILNKFWKRRYKIAIKKMDTVLKKKDSKEIIKFFPKFQSELMKAAKNGAIKKKNVSRRVSRLSKKIKNFKK